VGGGDRESMPDNVMTAPKSNGSIPRGVVRSGAWISNLTWRRWKRYGKDGKQEQDPEIVRGDDTSR